MLHQEGRVHQQKHPFPIPPLKFTSTEDQLNSWKMLGLLHADLCACLRFEFKHCTKVLEIQISEQTTLHLLTHDSYQLGPAQPCSLFTNIHVL